MKVIEALKDFDNRLLKRRELIIRIDYEGNATPSKEEIREFIAKKYAVEPERVEISKVLSDLGYPSGKVWAKIWDEPIVKKGEEDGEKTDKQVEA